MATYTNTFTATLCSRAYTGTANRYDGIKESPAAATVGSYSGTNWVGMVLVPVSLSGYRISSISLKLTANAAGSAKTKTVYIYSSNYQTTDASGRGSVYPKDQLGSISGNFRNSTVTVDLSGSLLSNMADYFSSGYKMLIFYDPYSSASDNYGRFTSVQVTITYSDPISFTWSNKKVSVSQTGKKVKVSWNAASGSGGSGSITYYLYVNGENNCVYQGTGLSFELTPPKYDENVSYFVLAVYSGLSIWSDTTYFSAKGATVSTPGTPSITYKGGVFTLQWSGSTGYNGDSTDKVTYTLYYGDSQSGYTSKSKSTGTATSVSIASWVIGVECRFFVRASYAGKTADGGYSSYTIPDHNYVAYYDETAGQYILCTPYYCEDGVNFIEVKPSYCPDGQSYIECSN